jgi:hypothetical protein
LAADNQVVAKAILPDNYVAGSQIHVRIAWTASVTADKTFLLDGLSVVFDASTARVIASTMPHHRMTATSGVITSGTSNYVYYNNSLDATNASGWVTDGDDIQVGAGDLVTITIVRTDTLTEEFKILSVELDWS